MQDRCIHQRLNTRPAGQSELEMPFAKHVEYQVRGRLLTSRPKFGAFLLNHSIARLAQAK
jgi:hypothetical protein